MVKAETKRTISMCHSKRKPAQLIRTSRMKSLVIMRMNSLRILSANLTYAPVQQKLALAECSLFFLNALKDSARSHVFKKCSSDMPFKEAVKWYALSKHVLCQTLAAVDLDYDIAFSEKQDINKITSKKQEIRSSISYIEHMSPLQEP